MNKLFGGLFVLLLTIDEGIKQYIEDTFKKNEERPAVIKPVVLRKVHNKGFSFNVLDKYPKIIKICSTAMMAAIFVFDYFLFQKRGKWIEKLAMVSLTAGAVSNTFDRIARGYVVDYIGVKEKRTTANLADFYLVIGLIIWMMKEIKK